LIDLIGKQEVEANGQGPHKVKLDAYGYRWFRAKQDGLSII